MPRQGSSTNLAEQRKREMLAAAARTDLEGFFSASALEAAFSSLGLRLSFLLCGTSPPEAWLSIRCSAAVGSLI